MNFKLEQLAGQIDAKFEALRVLLTKAIGKSSDGGSGPLVDLQDSILQHQDQESKQPYLPDGFPRFDGHEFCTWRSKCEQYFSLEYIAEARRMRLILRSMQGWTYQIINSKGITRWLKLTINDSITWEALLLDKAKRFDGGLYVTPCLN